LLEPARDFTNPAGHQLEERALRAVCAQLPGALIQNTGHVVKVVPGFVDDRGGASEEQQGGGSNSSLFSGLNLWSLRRYFSGKPRAAARPQMGLVLGIEH
jgi:hypothetical protein